MAGSGGGFGVRVLDFHTASTGGFAPAFLQDMELARYRGAFPCIGNLAVPMDARRSSGEAS